MRMSSSSDFEGGIFTNDLHHETQPAVNGVAGHPGNDDTLDADFSELVRYPENEDYYTLLGLSKKPPPTDAQIRSAYRTLTLSFHPDKQPQHLREAAEVHFDKIHEAYETLVDSKKRTVYDLLGAGGVRREWSAGGVMGRGRVVEGNEIGVRAMNADEFRHWFLQKMKARERKAVNSLVHARGSIALGIDAKSMFAVSEDGDFVYLHFPTLYPTSYSIGYSFKAPLPTFRSLWSIDEQGEDYPGTETPVEDREPGSTEITFSASVAGKVRTLTRQFEFMYEDGRKETKDLPLPPFLVARTLSLGVGFHHTFRSLGLSRNSSTKSLFLHLDGTNIAANALILPSPLLQTSISKSYAPFPGTQPFNITVRTVFTRTPATAPPAIGFEISRPLGVNRHVYCSWYSGTLSWPSIIQRLLIPVVQLGMDPELAFSVPFQMSKLQFGYISLPPKIVIQRDSDGDAADATGEKPESTNGAESWGCQANASPQGGSLEISYGRNLFSSEEDSITTSVWNSEGHHPISPVPGQRPVRLEVQTTLGFDLSLGWTISGTRRFGEFTRMGLGIGVHGGKGLVMTVTWSRLGQKINVPIAVCPLELVNADIAAVAVILPWATYCGIEFGYIRPRERRRRRLAVARRQMELKKMVSKRKVESQQAIDLMREQVQRRQAKEAAQGGLVIIRAEYGYSPPPKQKVEGEVFEKRMIDVTIPVAALVDHSQLIIPRDISKFQIIGFHDPTPLLPKRLRIWYKFGDREHMVEANDCEGIACPMRSHLVVK